MGRSVQFSLRRRSPAGARKAVSRRVFGAPERLAVSALALAVLSACAVGPDFKAPEPPPVTGYTPEAHPAPTVAVGGMAGASQKFVLGRDIPGAVSYTHLTLPTKRIV